jgi:hypothetical protein
MQNSADIGLALLDAKDICEITGCCLRTIEYWVAQKKLPPAYRVRSKRMWLAKDLEAFIRSRPWTGRCKKQTTRLAQTCLAQVSQELSGEATA